MIKPYELLFYNNSVDDCADCGTFQNDHYVVMAYTKAKDGWFIDLGFASDTDEDLDGEALDFLVKESGLPQQVPVNTNCQIVEGKKFYSRSAFLPEHPMDSLIDPTLSTPYSDFQKVFRPVYEAIINLDIEKLRGGNRDMTDDQLLVQTHYQRSQLIYATGTQRVESIRWLHHNWLRVVAASL